MLFQTWPINQIRYIPIFSLYDLTLLKKKIIKALTINNEKIIISIFYLHFSSLFAQPYSNSWIDYSKTYYKFNIGKTGLFRIPESTLNSIGLGNTPAEQFQLWRNGEEVSLYTPYAKRTS